MCRRLVLTALAWALLTAPASAALTEAPYAASGGSSACLRATGKPGELALLGPEGKQGAVDVWTASPTGATRTQRVPLPYQSGCAEIASAPSGAAVLAATAQRSPGNIRRRLLVATRPPGGTFGPAVEVAQLAGFDTAVAVAVNARGDAVVLWRDAVSRATSPEQRISVRAVRRTGEGPLGPVEAVDDTTDDEAGPSGAIAAAVDGAGTATAAWARGASSRVVTATAPAGAGFGTPLAVPGGKRAGEAIALAAAADGRVLLAAASFDRFTLAERAPGEAEFGPVVLPRGVARLYPDRPSVALAGSGAALVAWRTQHTLGGGVQAMWRAAPGAFGRPQTLAASAFESSPFGVSEPEIVVFGGVEEESPQELDTALAPDGRAIVSWIGAGRGRTAPALAAAATGDVTHGLDVQRFPGPVRAAQSVAAWLTSDGAPSLAWSDSDALGFLGFVKAKGRLHVAAPGATPAVAAPAPRLTVRVARHPVLYRNQSLPVTVRCSAACDVRIATAGEAQTRSLHRGRSVRVRIGLPERGRFRRPLVVRATASAPGGHAATTVRRVRTVRRRPAPPVPRIRALRARRTAAGIVVTWRTSVPVRRFAFLAVLTRGRGTGQRSLLTYTEKAPDGRRRHRLLIRAADGAPGALARARYLRLYTFALDRDREAGSVVVHVR